MSVTGVLAVASPTDDTDLVARVRAGDDGAFEELYRRYKPRITAYVRRMVSDPARAEDVAQEAFISALRRMRETDARIAFKPWIFEIARNASIDLYRRTSRAEELSIDADEGLSPADRGRLVGPSAPDSQAIAKEKLDHLCGAFDELSEVHARLLVMRELEGMSYREIADRMRLSRSSVESSIFRARRRLAREYEELSEGRRCRVVGAAIARLAEGVESPGDRLRLGRHARRCSICRRLAREMGVEPLGPRPRLPGRAAALLPLPWLARRWGHAAAAAEGASPSAFGTAASHVGAVVAERAAALVATVALVGAGGAAAGSLHAARDTPAPAAAAPGQRAPTPAAPSARHRGRHAVAHIAARPKSPPQRVAGGRGAPASGTGPGGAAPPSAPSGAAPAAPQPAAAEPPAAKEPAVGGQKPPAVELPKLPSVELPKLPAVELPHVGAPPAAAPPPATPPPRLPLPDLGGQVRAVTGTVEQTLGTHLP
ncbi:MAG TPA: sigma-70 family RNA polymerase sigma factor [Thermoleophilaceae bacterium]|jgi:RNA polymerase sigma factor (sigma-70 family)